MGKHKERYPRNPANLSQHPIEDQDLYTCLCGVEPLKGLIGWATVAQGERAIVQDEIDALLMETPVLFGLRAQGHITTVEAMLRDGCTWTEIGKAIGWDGMTVERFYEMERDTNG